MEQQIYKNITNHNSEIPVPKYYLLKMDIINKIDTGVWAEHEKLPSENVLCEQYGISRTTVRKTFDELSANKYIYKIQGKGTYVEEVSKRRKDLPKEDYGCSEMIRRYGKTPSHQIIRLELSEIQAEDDVLAECLGLKPGEQIVSYERIYCSDGQPIIYAKTAINQKYLPGFSEIDLGSKPLSEVLREDYGLTVTRERCVFRAIPANEEISAALGVSLNFPILYRAVVCRATNGTDIFPVETSQLYCRTDCMPVEIK